MTSYFKDDFIADPWTYLADDAPIPQSGNVIVPLTRWRENIDTLSNRDAPTGVAISPDDSLDRDTDQTSKLALVSVEFPKFTDGRGYSQARTLREQHEFTGEIRARGEVLIDQIPLMLRCGINAFEISHEPTARAMKAGEVPGLEHGYQSPATKRFGGTRRPAA